jgi:hypothetical protein
MKSKNSEGTTSRGVRPRNHGLAGTVGFFFIAVLVAAGLLYAGRKLYELAVQPSSAYYTKLGELTLQLAIIVIVGALIKAAIDWGTTQRARHLATLEIRMDFIRQRPLECTPKRQDVWGTATTIDGAQSRSGGHPGRP